MSDVAEACRLALDGFSGLMGTTHVDAATLVNERDLFEDDPLVFRVSQDFEIVHDEG